MTEPAQREERMAEAKEMLRVRATARWVLAARSSRREKGERERREEVEEAVVLGGPRVEGVEGRGRGVGGVVESESAATRGSGVLCDMVEVVWMKHPG